MPSS
ncbi:hypothetical protein YPPY103_0737, partial [Yersinia pestis PY-103]|jgi:hypothetical protein